MLGNLIVLEPDELGVTIKVIQLREKSSTKVSAIPFYNDVIPTRANIDNIGPIELTQLRTTPLDEPFNAALKRSFDIMLQTSKFSSIESKGLAMK